MKTALSYYLRKYYDNQSKILLVYHPTEDSTWSDRCFYLETKYNPHKEYNHRSILYNEVVIEHDTKDKAENKRLALEVSRRLTSDGVQHLVWSSGNKSCHVHIIFDFGSCRNPTLLKRTIMRYYTDGLPLPDLQLASPNHLIRAEHGVHERTGQRKSLITGNPTGLGLQRVVPAVWERYNQAVREGINRQARKLDNNVHDHPGLRYILTAHQFRESGDGRERALFMLIHLLKPQHTTVESLVTTLQQWYRYSSTTAGLTDQQIERKVRYHWDRHYSITERYLEELLESIGRHDLVAKKKE